MDEKIIIITFILSLVSIISTLINRFNYADIKEELEEELEEEKQKIKEIESSIDEIKRNIRITDKRINLRDYIVFEKLKELEKERLNENIKRLCNKIFC